MSHTVYTSGSANYTANFTTQYYLTNNATTGGSVSPASGWYNSGAVMGISASASSGYFFNNWTGTGAGSYSGTNSPASVTMNGPITETANFLPQPQLKSITLGTNLVIFWPTNAAGFTLKATNLLVKASNWPVYNNNPSVVGTNYQVVIPLTGGKQFFRLGK